MRKSLVFDLLTVLRCIGYGLAAALGLVFLAMLGLTLAGAPAWGTVASIFVPGILAGLTIAWTASLARVFLRFSRFVSPQE